MSGRSAIRPVHPFPARMAPDLAITSMASIRAGGLVLDPMAGSGTVLRHAAELGLNAIGCDVDPLSVLMARVWTTPVKDEVVASLAEEVIAGASDLKHTTTNLPWMDGDAETERFVEYWFGEAQRDALRRIAAVLFGLQSRRLQAKRRAAADVLRLALSRIIITKDQGASLGRDISHSRPHKVADTSDFDVEAAFARSVRQIRKLLADAPPPGRVEIRQGDARCLRAVENESIDAAVTSPPYLNAIDYMRGHRLSLIWFGHKLSELRAIRSGSVGAERGPDHTRANTLFSPILGAMVPLGGPELESRHQAMLARYAEDTYRLSSELARVLKTGGRAILVVGNSCLKGTFVRNSDGVRTAAAMVGLNLCGESERELPESSRYLPMPTRDAGPLGKRMRTETILTFMKH